MMSAAIFGDVDELREHYPQECKDIEQRSAGALTDDVDFIVVFAGGLPDGWAGWPFNVISHFHAYRTWAVTIVAFHHA